MIGTNDLTYGKDVNYIIENYKKIISNIQNASPETKIYIQSELPTDDAIHQSRKNTDLITINKHLKEIANENNLIYIDLFSLFANNKNKMNPEYSLDGLHINGKGYLIWKKAIIKYINE